jgi:hypothetical protein
VEGIGIRVWAINGFWNYFGGVQMIDTTLRFEQFGGYIARELMPKELPEMTSRAKQRFRTSVQDIFNNAVAHAASDVGITTCGQHYPQSKQRISFAVADLGVGFKHNLERFTGKSWDTLEAIEWALEQGHTTRVGSVPGGLGLTWLFEFVQANGGELQIVSHDGYWGWQDGFNESFHLESPFPGTVVVLHINTDDMTLHDVPDSSPQNRPSLF